MAVWYQLANPVDKRAFIRSHLPQTLVSSLAVKLRPNDIQSLVNHRDARWEGSVMAARAAHCPSLYSTNADAEDRDTDEDEETDEGGYHSGSDSE